MDVQMLINKCRIVYVILSYFIFFFLVTKNYYNRHRYLKKKKCPRQTIFDSTFDLKLISKYSVLETHF